MCGRWPKRSVVDARQFVQHVEKLVDALAAEALFERFVDESMMARPAGVMRNSTRRPSLSSLALVMMPRSSSERMMRVRLGARMKARSAMSEASTVPASARMRMTRHCCSVMSCSASIGRKCVITASRARNSAIGRERRVLRGNSASCGNLDLDGVSCMLALWCIFPSFSIARRFFGRTSRLTHRTISLTC